MRSTNVNKKHGINVIISEKRIPSPRMAKRLKAPTGIRKTGKAFSMVKREKGPPRAAEVWGESRKWIPGLFCRVEFALWPAPATCKRRMPEGLRTRVGTWRKLGKHRPSLPVHQRTGGY
jgi:hypothetical protein